MTGIAVELIGVSKRFGGTCALDDVSLTIASGAVHGIVGPNGSGKSTLVKILTGFHAADRGDVLLDGERREVGSPLEARGLGIELVAQELSLVPEMSVWENIVLGAEPRRRGRLDVPACRDLASRVLQRLRLDLDLDAGVGTVNPAEQRLLMIARTLHRGARLLIVDEPTAGLPPEQAQRVVEVLRDVAGSGVTIVFVSHHLAEVASLCDGVTVLTDGVVTGSLTGDALDQNSLVEAIMGEASDVTVRERPRSEVGAGERVVAIEGLAGGSLQDLSLEAVRGEVVGIAGLLGSGREVVMDLVVGASRRQSGSVEVMGRSLTSPRFAPSRGVGFLSGDRTRAAIPDWLVEGHVTLPGLRQWRRRGTIDRRAEREAAGQAVEALSVKGAPSDRFEHLSGGNQQRVLFAQWVATSVDLLLVDEPCVGVDIASRKELLGVLRGMADDRCVVLSSSDPADLAEVCDRVVCLYRGRVVSELVGGDVTERQILSDITGVDASRMELDPEGVDIVELADQGVV